MLEPDAPELVALPADERPKVQTRLLCDAFLGYLLDSSAEELPVARAAEVSPRCLERCDVRGVLQTISLETLY